MEGKFYDARWVDGNWDLAQFKGRDGETDWDAVIDAEARARYAPRAPAARARPLTHARTVPPTPRQVVRRRRLEISPEVSELEDEVKARCALATAPRRLARIRRAAAPPPAALTRPVRTPTPRSSTRPSSPGGPGCAASTCRRRSRSTAAPRCVRRAALLVSTPRLMQPPAVPQMIGFATGYFVDALTGAGLVDQARAQR